jgi:hypothetical protein
MPQPVHDRDGVRRKRRVRELADHAGVGALGRGVARELEARDGRPQLRRDDDRGEGRRGRRDDQNRVGALLAQRPLEVE